MFDLQKKNWGNPRPIPTANTKANAGIWVRNTQAEPTQRNSWLPGAGTPAEAGKTSANQLRKGYREFLKTEKPLYQSLPACKPETAQAQVGFSSTRCLFFSFSMRVSPLLFSAINLRILLFLPLRTS
jgi:hypothetical protein